MSVTTVKPHRTPGGKFAARLTIDGVKQHIGTFDTFEEAEFETARRMEMYKNMPSTKRPRSYFKAKSKKKIEDDRVQDARILCEGTLCSKLDSQYRSSVRHKHAECEKCWSHDIIPKDLKRRPTLRWDPNFSTNTSYQG